MKKPWFVSGIRAVSNSLGKVQNPSRILTAMQPLVNCQFLLFGQIIPLCARRFALLFRAAHDTLLFFPFHS
jgi:hypothetical protein